MADSKKYDGSQWEHSLRKLTTATDTLITLPADVYADGNSATVGLVGNMSQTGTPTPSSPIQPSECGDLETEGAKAGQYKIPISSANTTTPVYLGEVETTRKIKKYEFTGLEDWILRAGTPENEFFCERQDVNFINNAAICSHYQNQNSGSFADLQDKHFLVRVASSGDKTYLAIRDSSYPSTNEGVAQLSSFLQQQYANGTPVTVWYVLATETTGIVNEPIRKIGTYADTVSGISIPTITGKDTFDVLTTLKPSEVSLTYTGWHDASVKEWDGSDWQ